MEEVVLKVKVEGSGDSEAKIKTVKQQLREAKEAALQAKEGTEEYFQALQKAAGLADQLKDVNEAVNQLDPGGKAAAFGNLINTVAGGFQTITGLYGLLGAKSEDVEKVLLRVQAASALAMGLQSLVEAQKQWKNLSAVIRNAAIVQEVYTLAVGATTSAMKALRLAIAATGIGALVYAIYELTVNTKESLKFMDKFLDKLGGLGKILKYVPNLYTLGKAIGWVKEQMGLGSEAAGDYEEHLKLVGEALDKIVTTELKRRNSMQGGANDIERQIKLLQAQGKTVVETAGLENKLFAIRIKNIDDEIALRKTYGQDVVDLEQQKKDLINQDLTRQAGVTKFLADELAKRKKLLEDENKLIVESANKAQQEQDRLENDKGMKNAERRQKELDANKDFNQQLIEAARTSTNEIATIEDIGRRQQIQQAEDIRNAKLSLAQSTVEGLSALGNILIKDGKKATIFQKGIALAQIAIDTAKAIAGLTAASNTNPLNAPTGGLAGIAQFASGIAQILANVAQAKKILSGGDVTSIAGGGGGGSNISMPSGAGLTPPSIQPPTNTSGLIQEGTDFKVYVVESDITNTQQGVQQNKKKALITI
jgi:hypothetical protein